MEPNMINLKKAQATRIAFASSESDGRARWAELAVYWMASPPLKGRPWLAESRGVSSIEGERAIVRRMNVGSLARALKLFEDTDLGIIVKEEALDWAESREKAASGAGAARPEPARGGPAAGSELPVLTSDDDALLWLYEKVDGPARNGQTPTFVSMLAADLGIPRNTLSVQKSTGRPLKVPFLAIAPFIDREAFRAWHAKRLAERVK